MRIKKLIFEDVPHEAKPNDVFGKYLFDRDRKDIPKTEKQPETPEEEDFKKGLFQWINNQVPYKIAQEFPDVYKLAQKGKYSNLLVPENEPIYRGISFSSGNLDLFFKTTGLSKEDLARNPGDERLWVFENGVLETEHSPILSWTTKKEVLKNFAYSFQEYVVLFKTTPTKKNGKFLLNPDELNSKVKMPKLYKKENEVISYGPVRYEKMIIWINPEESKQTGEPRANSKFLFKDMFANL